MSKQTRKQNLNTANVIETKRKVSLLKISIMALCLVATLALMTACGGDTKKSEKSSGGGTKKIDVSLVDTPAGMHIEPSEITVANGTDVVLNVTNDGTVIHNLKPENGEGTADMAPYSSAELPLGKITKDTELNCTVAGHKEAGMVLNIKVK